MPETDINPIVASKDAHEIGKHFYDIQQQFIPIKEINYGSYIIRKDYFPGTPQAYTAVDYYAQDFSGDLEKQYYIRFGRFLEFLKERIIPNVNYDPNIKVIKIDYNVKSNIIHVLPKIVSADPKVCCICTAFKYKEKTYQYAPYCSEFIIPFNDDAIKGKYGYVMNIYFNMEWILAKINELKDDKGKISLYGLLDALCKGFNEATGHYNRLEPVIDAEENIIRILDDVALPDKKAILKSSLLSGSFGDELKELAVFDTYGYYTGTSGSAYGRGVPHAGFIKDLSFTTTVSPELATMITVGSTNKGYIKGQDATSLSRMNNGLVDRFKKEITDTNQEKDVAPPPLNEEYKTSIEAFNLYIQNLGVSEPSGEPNYDGKSVDAYKNTQTQFVEYQQAQETQQEKINHPESTAASPNSGFLPFDLSLTMDGLSGMKVYQSFYMDTAFLPTNYPGTLEFLIKGITHKIEGNQWTTNIESMAIPKNPFATGSIDNPVDEASRNTNRGKSSTSGPGNLKAIKGNSDLSIVLINAGYAKNTSKYQLAYSIGTKEGWNSRANGGIGSRSYRNNNPGNLNYSSDLRAIDPDVQLENNPYGDSRFAHFTTAELGAKALVETKIKKWANGNMPITKGNQSLIVAYRGGDKYKAGTNPTIAQFFYTYAPPSDGNDTEKYINDVIKDLTKTKPGTNRNTLVKTILA